MSRILLFILALTSSLKAFAGDDPSVVPQVDLKRYSGFWFEIAHSPNFFQGSCERSTAEYGLNQDGSISVLNSCFRNNEPYRSIRGVARVVDSATPAKLKVDFGFFRKGDYWIVALDENYEWAVVSGPAKSSLFILARRAPMDPALLENILSGLKARSFELDNLIYDKY